MNRLALFPITLLLPALLLAGCSTLGRNGARVDVDLRQVLPLQDRDHFVYLWQRIINGRRVAEGVQIEHVSARPTANEIDVTLSQDGTPATRMRMYYDGQRLDLLAEDDLASGLRRTYDPPLRQLSAPLGAGEERRSARAVVTRIDDGMAMAEIEVEQTVRVSHIAKVESHLGRFDRGVVVESWRTLEGPDGKLELMSAMVLVPGIGELRSEGMTLGGPSGGRNPVLRRELACAIVRDRAIGDCRSVSSQLAELRGREDLGER